MLWQASDQKRELWKLWALWSPSKDYQLACLYFVRTKSYLSLRKTLEFFRKIILDLFQPNWEIQSAAHKLHCLINALLPRLSLPPSQSPVIDSDCPSFKIMRKKLHCLLEGRIDESMWEGRLPPTSLILQSSGFIMSTHNAQAYFSISQTFIEPLLYAKYSARVCKIYIWKNILRHTQTQFFLPTRWTHVPKI